MYKIILLVEDDFISAYTGKKSLENYYKYKVIIVNSGKKAIEAINTMPEINLVIMDIELGGGIDGVETALIILENHPIPIIFWSSLPKSEIVKLTGKIKSYGYVEKSSDISVLADKIKKAFRQHYGEENFGE